MLSYPTKVSEKTESEPAAASGRHTTTEKLPVSDAIQKNTKARDGGRFSISYWVLDLATPVASPISQLYKAKNSFFGLSPFDWVSDVYKQKT